MPMQLLEYILSLRKSPWLHEERAQFTLRQPEGWGEHLGVMTRRGKIGCS